MKKSKNLFLQFLEDLFFSWRYFPENILSMKKDPQILKNDQNFWKMTKIFAKLPTILKNNPQIL